MEWTVLIRRERTHEQWQEVSNGLRPDKASAFDDRAAGRHGKNLWRRAATGLGPEYAVTAASPSTKWRDGMNGASLSAGYGVQVLICQTGAVAIVFSRCCAIRRTRPGEEG